MHLSGYLFTALSFIKQPQKRKWIKLSYSLKNQLGLEIGGPSNFFSIGGYFPVYIFSKQVDVANFSDQTVWEGNIKEGMNYHYYKNKTGYQYIGEATDLSKIKDQQYNYLLSCHSLEHVANPLKALFEWRRVLQPNGKLILILPYKEFTFDHNRPFTNFAHLLKDYSDNVDEHDTTHFEEVLSLHDTTKDPGFISTEAFKERLSKNFENRCIHHHVFNGKLVTEMLNFAGFQVDHQDILSPFHLFTMATKKD